MKLQEPRVVRVVPRHTVYAWVGSLVALPLVWAVLDPLTRNFRLLLESVPGVYTVLEIVKPFGKLETLAVAVAIGYFVSRTYRWRRARRWLRVTATATLSSGVLVYLIKLIFRRDRPAVTSDAIDATGLAAITTGKCMSFPSGDTAVAFAAAVVLAAYVPSLRWPAAVMAGLVGLSRIYFGCHYFSDVLAGALVGSLVAAIVLTVTRPSRALP